MPDTILKLNRLEEQEEECIKPFEAYEEEVIISLALDFPEFFTGIIRFFKPGMFRRAECQWVVAQIINEFEKHGEIITRKLLEVIVSKSFTEDDPYEPVLRVIKRRCDPREIPTIKDMLLRWSRDRAYGMMFSEEAEAAYSRGDYDRLEQIMHEAQRVGDVGQRGLWLLDQYEELLVEDEEAIHFTTGFRQLDEMLNNGGPSPKEVVCFMGATNVGKSIVLCNSAIASLIGRNRDGGEGNNVLLISFELDAKKTATRCLGPFLGMPIKDAKAKEHKAMVDKRFHMHKATYANAQIGIFEWAADERSVTDIYALLDHLRHARHFQPDVIVLDYMDLMMSRNPGSNDTDYSRQKHVANEIRGLAKNEDVLIFTATQTNRTATMNNNSGPAEMSQAAESYGKQFALDYIVSLNQNNQQRTRPIPEISMWIAKNRNGPRATGVRCEVDYNQMLVREAGIV